MKNIFLILIISLVAFSCKKETYQDASFKCKVNGDEYFASDNLISVDYTEASRTMIIEASKATFDSKSQVLYGVMKLNFTIPDPANGTSIKLDSVNTYRWSNNGDQTYRSSANYPGTLTINSFDVDAKTISATFSLSAYSENGTSVEITDGNINLNWGEL